MKTKVIFRIHKGELLALFPAIAGTNQPRQTCLCYAHVGQHSSASVDITLCSRLATRKEYAPLARELRGLGYKLDVRKRFTPSDFAERQKQVN